MTHDSAPAGPSGFTIIPNWMLTDERVSGPMLTTYAALASYADREGVCWPSLRALGDRARLKPTALREALSALHDLGVLSRTARARQDGGRTSDLYRIALHERALTGWPTPLRQTEGGVRHAEGAPPSGGGQEQDPENNTHSSPLQAPQGADPVLDGLDTPAADGPDHFDTFWGVYPRKVGKPQALRAWQKAIKNGTHWSVIVGAASMYADDPNREAAFTKHPSSWLNGEGWNDDPLPERPQPVSDRPQVAPAPVSTMSERVVDCADVGRAHKPLRDGTCMLCEARSVG